MLVEQGAGVEIILMAVHTLTPVQMADAVEADHLASGQARVAKMQGPAQVALSGAGFAGVVEVIADIAGVGVHAGEIVVQCRQALDPVQRIAEGDVIAVQVFQAL